MVCLIHHNFFKKPITLTDVCMSIYEAQWEPTAEFDSLDFYDHGNVCGEDTVYISMKILKRHDWTVQSRVIVFSVYNYCMSCKSGHELSICNYLRNQWCLVLLTWQTDPENTDYVCENGATRNFQAQKLLEDEENRRQREEEEEQQNNPMKVKTLLCGTEACSSYTLNAICLPLKGNHHL